MENSQILLNLKHFQLKTVPYITHTHKDMMLISYEFILYSLKDFFET